jgi:hypothetical protein
MGKEERAVRETCFLSWRGLCTSTSWSPSLVSLVLGLVRGALGWGWGSLLDRVKELDLVYIKKPSLHIGQDSSLSHGGDSVRVVVLSTDRRQAHWASSYHDQVFGKWLCSSETKLPCQLKSKWTSTAVWNEGVCDFVFGGARSESPGLCIFAQFLIFHFRNFEYFCEDPSLFGLHCSSSQWTWEE